MTLDPNDHPQTLEYATSATPLNAYQRASVFVLRVVGLLLLAYACVGTVGLLAGVAFRLDVYPLGRHLVGIAEYGLLGAFSAGFAKPVGRWLGSAA